MRRKEGTQLVRNERRVLAAALKLAFERGGGVYGYDLFTRLSAWEGEAPMNHGTLYRCLRSLESRGLLSSSINQSTEHVRVVYSLTAEGEDAARKATIALAAEEKPLPWVDVGLAVRPLRRRARHA